MPIPRRRLLRAFSFTLAGAWGARNLLACGDAATDDPAPTGSGSAPPAPLPVPTRPSTLRATGVVRDVQRAHDAAKESWGVTAFHGKSWAATAVELAGLPVEAADLVDEAGVLRVAASGPDAASLAMVFAVPLRDPSRLIAMVTQGEAAAFRAARDPPTGLDHLEPKTAPADPKTALAVANHHLIVGPSSSSVAELGPFLSQPVSAELETPKADFEARLDPVAAAALSKRASALQARAGADLAPFVELMKLEDAPSGLREVRVVGSVKPRALEARVTLSFEKAAPDLGCAQGRRDDLLGASADATLAAVWFTNEETRVASAEKAARWLADAKLARADGRAGEALLSIARARGATVRMCLERSEMGWLAYGVTDTIASKSIDDALDVLGEALDGGSKEASSGLSLSMSKTVLEKYGDVRRLRINRREASSKEAKALATIFFLQQSGHLAFATGADAAYALGKEAVELGKTGEIPKLADVARVTQIVEALDRDAGWFFYVDPVALGASRPPPVEERGALVGSAKTCGKDWSIALAAEPRALSAIVSALRAG